MSRPQTSKPRGICIHYNTDRGCRAGDSCKFLHGPDEQLTPYDKSKTCRFYIAGYCKRGDKCWFRHAIPDPDSSPNGLQCPPPLLLPDDNVCGICLEEPVTFGLLSGCSHVFCIECIRSWRDPKGKTEDVLCSRVNKKCPYCRTSSSLILPSSLFYPEGHPGKSLVFDRYKSSLSKVPCKYFQNSPPKDRYCPFGCDCLYQHRNSDNTPYVFTKGVGHYMPQMQQRLGRGRRTNNSDAYIGFGEMRDVSSFIFDLFRHLPTSQTNEEEEPLTSQLDVTAAPLIPTTDIDRSETQTSEDHPSQFALDDGRRPQFWAFDLHYIPDGYSLDMAPMSSLESPPASFVTEDDDGAIDEDPDIATMASMAPMLSRFLNRTTIQSSSVRSVDVTPGQEYFSPPLEFVPESVRPPAVSHAGHPSEYDADIDADGIESDIQQPTQTPDHSTESQPAIPREDESSQQCGIEGDLFAGLDEPAPEPPFTTDGRGRVVWSRDGSKNFSASSHMG